MAGHHLHGDTLLLLVPAVLTIEKSAASFLADVPIGWPPRAKQQPAGLIAYGAAHRLTGCVC